MRQINKTHSVTKLTGKSHACFLVKYGLKNAFRPINCDLYAYAANNPLRYIDPDGRKIKAITSRNYQNESINRNLDIGKEETGFYNSSGTYVRNTIGKFGCLFTCVINIGNSYNREYVEEYSDHALQDYSKQDKYFNFFLSPKVLGTDFVTGCDEIKTLLKDMTGQNFTVDRIRDKGFAHLQMIIADLSTIKDAYIIADVGGHFINITKCTEAGKIEYFDPYQRSVPKEYTLKDINGIYLISWEQ